MSEPYAELVTQVTEHPGVHFNELVRMLAVAPDTLQRLRAAAEAADTIVVEEHYGKTHFYPAEYSPSERHILALLRRETSRAILVCLLTTAPTTPATVADTVGIARSTLEWHLDRLIDAALIEKHRDGRRVTLVVTDGEQIKRVLCEVKPQLAAQLDTQSA